VTGLALTDTSEATNGWRSGGGTQSKQTRPSYSGWIAVVHNRRLALIFVSTRGHVQEKLTQPSIHACPSTTMSANLSHLRQHARPEAAPPTSENLDGPWFYVQLRPKAKVGPITKAQLKEAWEHHSIDANTMVWKKGRKNWEKVIQIPVLHKFLSEQPPQTIPSFKDSRSDIEYLPPTHEFGRSKSKDALTASKPVVLDESDKKLPIGDLITKRGVTEVTSNVLLSHLAEFLKLSNDEKVKRTSEDNYKLLKTFCHIFDRSLQPANPSVQTIKDPLSYLNEYVVRVLCLIVDLSPTAASNVVLYEIGKSLTSKIGVGILNAPANTSEQRSVNERRMLPRLVLTNCVLLKADHSLLVDEITKSSRMIDTILNTFLDIMKMFANSTNKSIVDVTTRILCTISACDSRKLNAFVDPGMEYLEECPEIGQICVDLFMKACDGANRHPVRFHVSEKEWLFVSALLQHIRRVCTASSGMFNDAQLLRILDIILPRITLDIKPFTAREELLHTVCDISTALGSDCPGIVQRASGMLADLDKLSSGGLSLSLSGTSKDFIERLRKVVPTSSQAKEFRKSIFDFDRRASLLPPPPPGYQEATIDEEEPLPPPTSSAAVEKKVPSRGNKDGNEKKESDDADDENDHMKAVPKPIVAPPPPPAAPSGGGAPRRRRRAPPAASPSTTSKAPADSPTKRTAPSSAATPATTTTTTTTTTSTTVTSRTVSSDSSKTAERERRRSSVNLPSPPPASTATTKKATPLNVRPNKISSRTQSKNKLLGAQSGLSMPSRTIAAPPQTSKTAPPPSSSSSATGRRKPLSRSSSKDIASTEPTSAQDAESKPQAAQPVVVKSAPEPEIAAAVEEEIGEIDTPPPPFPPELEGLDDEEPLPPPTEEPEDLEEFDQPGAVHEAVPQHTYGGNLDSDRVGADDEKSYEAPPTAASLAANLEQKLNLSPSPPPAAAPSSPPSSTSAAPVVDQTKETPKATPAATVNPTAVAAAPSEVEEKTPVAVSHSTGRVSVTTPPVFGVPSTQEEEEESKEATLQAPQSPRRTKLAEMAVSEGRSISLLPTSTYVYPL